MKSFKFKSLPAVLSLALLAGAAAAQVVKIDGSSTVYPITEAVAEEFQKANKGRQGDRRHLRHRRRLQEVLPRRDRHLRRLPPDHARRKWTPARRPASSTSSCRSPTTRSPWWSTRKNDWVKQLTVDELKKIWEPAAQGKVTQLEPGQPGLAGRSRSSSSARAPTPAPSTTSPRRSSARPRPAAATSPRSEDDNVLVQGVAGDKNALGYFGFAYYAENQDKLKAVPIVDEGRQAGGRPSMRDACSTAPTSRCRVRSSSTSTRSRWPSPR